MNSLYLKVTCVTLILMLQACQSGVSSSEPVVLDSSIALTPPVRANDPSRASSDRYCDAFMGYEKQSCLARKKKQASAAASVGFYEPPTVAASD